jgi:hypothetical protein
MSGSAPPVLDLPVAPAKPAEVKPVELPAKPERGGRGALLVAAGILFSRVFGLVRERVFAHYFGNSIEAAAFKAALRIPNFLQNLFGEGVLSASFIPVYVQLVAKKDREGADRLAGAIFGLLSVVLSALVLAGMLVTPLFIDVIAPGFKGESRELAIRLVRILFPGTGLLVLSAWCLGILNSHRRFFLSYAAPVLWNCAAATRPRRRSPSASPTARSSAASSRRRSSFPLFSGSSARSGPRSTPASSRSARSCAASFPSSSGAASCR